MLTVILDQTQYGIESAHTRIVGVARTKQSGQFQESFSQTGILGDTGIKLCSLYDVSHSGIGGPQ